MRWATVHADKLAALIAAAFWGRGGAAGSVRGPSPGLMEFCFGFVFFSQFLNHPVLTPAALLRKIY